jgi:hypothetical protein
VNGDGTPDENKRGAQAVGGAAVRLLVPERLRHMSDVRLAARLSEVVVNVTDRDELDALVVYLRGRGLL